MLPKEQVMAGWICPNCGLNIIAERSTCKQCGTAKSAAFQPTLQTSSGVLTSPLSAASTKLTNNEADSSQDYRMVQIPRTFRVQGQDNEAAMFLQNLVNEHSKAGWDFYRIDEVGVVSSPGCIAALLGVRESVIPYYIVTFKRNKSIL